MIISFTFPMSKSVVNIPAHVRPETLCLGWVKTGETLITALVSSRVRMHYPEACCKTT